MEAVMITDLRDEILMFELTGPRSTALLHAILSTVDVDISTQASGIARANTVKANYVFNTLKHLRSATSLPSGAVLGITVQDPRLR
jgi:ribonuclease P/MRP protein subunit POP1